MLSAEQREKFLLLCPDFLIKLRSPSDHLGKLQEKMQEYLDNGAQLAWLIDPDQKKVYVYRPVLPIEELESPASIHGNSVLPGFVLDLEEIW